MPRERYKTEKAEGFKPPAFSCPYGKDVEYEKRFSGMVKSPRYCDLEIADNTKTDYIQCSCDIIVLMIFLSSVFA